MAKKILGLVIALCLIVGLLPMAALADTPAAVQFAFYEKTLGNNEKKTVTLDKDATLYYKNATRDSLKCLETGDADNWNLKLDYTGDVPVATMKGMESNAGFVGFEFIGGDSDLTIVVEEDSSILIKETTGNNYYNAPALALGTTGTVTITGEGKLTMSANAEYGNRATVVAGGDLVLDNANVALDDDSTWGDVLYGLLITGKLTIKGGVFSSHQTKYLPQSIKCADFEAKEKAIVNIWAANSDYDGAEAPCIEATTIKIDAANVSIGCFDKAFSVEPTITNCTSAKGSTQNPNWNATYDELTFKSDSPDNEDWSTWTQFQSVHTCITADADCTTEDKCSCGDVIAEKVGDAHKYTDDKDTTCDNDGCTAGNRTVASGTTTGGTSTGGSSTTTTKPATGTGATNGNDKTGDAMALWTVVMAVSSLSAAAFVTSKKN